ncbi:MAG: hypothetical protein FJ271_03775 [Planctomycetes bacterium]|nr:hypothetical protein [Planctomycetota bacterium]
MRKWTALLLLVTSSGCAMDDFFINDFDDDYLDSGAVVYEGTSPAYRQAIPGGQPGQSSPTAPAAQTREPPR